MLPYIFSSSEGTWFSVLLCHQISKGNMSLLSSSCWLWFSPHYISLIYYFSFLKYLSLWFTKVSRSFLSLYQITYFELLCYHKNIIFFYLCSGSYLSSKMQPISYFWKILSFYSKGFSNVYLNNNRSIFIFLFLPCNFFLNNLSFCFNYCLQTFFWILSYRILFYSIFLYPQIVDIVCFIYTFSNFYLVSTIFP